MKFIKQNTKAKHKNRLKTVVKTFTMKFNDEEDEISSEEEDHDELLR